MKHGNPLSVYTPDRAERLCRSLEGDGYQVVRLLRESLVVSTREYNGVLLEARVYAQIWKGRDLRLLVTYERFGRRSVLL